MKGQANNVAILLGVIIVVGGVAWYRTSRSSTDTPLPPSVPVAGNTQPAPATAPAQKGELCPEPPPAAGPGNASATPATTQAAKLLPRVIDLGADKCKACKELAPILAELKKEYAGRAIVEFIDVWKNPKAGEAYGIRVIPTQIFFNREGDEVWRHEGFLPKAEFVSKLAELGAK